MRIIWTERASNNLEYFKIQIRQNSGLDDVADKFYQKVIDKVSKLENNPGWIGIPVKEYPGEGYKSLFVMDYRIIYRIKGKSVFIITFLHKKMIIKDKI